MVNKKDFWKFVEVANYKKDFNYEKAKIRALFVYPASKINEFHKVYQKLTDELDIIIGEFVVSSGIKKTSDFKTNKYLQYLFKEVYGNPKVMFSSNKKYIGKICNDSYNDVFAHIIGLGETTFEDSKKNVYNTFFTKDGIKFYSELFAYIFN